MRDDYRKVSGMLYGIGLGPGNPDLITLRAKQILDEVNLIFVPKSGEDKSSYARSIVESVIKRKKNFVELIFPMTKDKKALNLYWQQAAEKIAQGIAVKKKAAFLTIGDPFIYSTYIYLLEILRLHFPRIKTETIPGITSYNAAACLSGMPLVKGNEKLAILPVTKNLNGLKEAFKTFDTVVLMKVGSKLDRVITLLKEISLSDNAVLVSRLGYSNECIVRNISKLKNKKLGYLSVIIVKKNNKGS